MTIRDDLDNAAGVAEASTRAMFSATIIGLVPIIEFGLVVALTLLVVALPVKAIKKMVK